MMSQNTSGGAPQPTVRRISGISIALTLIALLLLVCLSWYFLFLRSAEDTSQDAIRDTSEIYLHEIASQKGNQIQMNLDSHMQRLAVTLEVMTGEQVETEAALQEFLARMKTANAFDFLGFLDEDGMVHTDERSFPAISKFHFITEELDGNIVEFNNTVSQENMVLFVVPVEGYQYGDTPLTALIGGVNTKTIASRMSLFDTDTHTNCEVILNNGAYVMQAPYDHLGSGSNFFSSMERRAAYDEDYSHAGLMAIMAADQHGFVSYRVDDVRYFTHLLAVEGTDWCLVATIPYNAVGDDVEVVRHTLTRNSVIQMAILVFVFFATFIAYLVMRRQQDRMDLARIRAEENSRAKTNFLSQMSHDIRTPMNAIMGFTNFAMKEPDIAVIQEDYLPKIQTSGQHLLMLINDVLEMSRIESGRLELHEAPVHLGSILREVTDIISVRAENEGLTLHAEDGVTDPAVYCDKLRLNQVLMNLLGNAVKFTPKGGSVTVASSQEPCGERGWAMYQVKVSDTGIGMSPEYLEHLFEPFSRERTSTVSGKEGTGLGLSIVKSIVDAVGGAITVASVQGQGTTFTVRLKLKQVEPELADRMEQEVKAAKQKLNPEELQKHFAGKRILLVEDNELNLMIAETLLDEAGFVVEQAEDGTIAVEMVSAAPAGYYDAVLMDVQMPIMNGYEATKAIRALGDERANVKIIAVTANAFAADVREAKDAGMDGHLPKPIEVEALYAMLMELTGGSLIHPPY